MAPLTWYQIQAFALIICQIKLPNLHCSFCRVWDQSDLILWKEHWKVSWQRSASPPLHIDWGTDRRSWSWSCLCVFWSSSHLEQYQCWWLGLTCALPGVDTLTWSCWWAPSVFLMLLTWLKNIETLFSDSFYPVKWKLNCKLQFIEFIFCIEWKSFTSDWFYWGWVY